MRTIDDNVKVLMLKGETGSNIKSIDKTATSGLVDTYTVTLTDGTKSNFNVTNGRDGKDGADFDTFEIGGRNLLRGSKDFSGVPYKSNRVTYSTETVSGVDCTVLSLDNSAGTSTLGYIDAVQWLIAGIGTAGAVYTASFWFKGSGTSQLFFNGPSGNTHVSRAVMTINGIANTYSHVDGRANFIASGSTVSDWTHCTVVYTLSGTVGSTTDKYLMWRVDNGSTLSIALPKLERSTKPSDWTPAPEDKADVSALAKKADASVIVPKASIESSSTASQSYAAGDYVIVEGVLRKVTSPIASGNQITDSNSASTTVTGELLQGADTVNDYKSVTRFEAPSVGNWNDVFTYDITRDGLYFIRLSVTYDIIDYGEATFRLYHNPNDGRQELDARVSIEQEKSTVGGVYLSYGTSEVYRFKKGDSVSVQCYSNHNKFAVNKFCGIHIVRIGA